MGFSVGRLQGLLNATKHVLKKLGPLTATIIADMVPGEERGDAQVPRLSVRRKCFTAPGLQLTRRTPFTWNCESFVAIARS